MADRKQIEKMIESVARRGASFTNHVQKTALAVIEHYRDHGDSTLACQLLDAMPKVGGVKLRQYLATFMRGEFAREDGATIFRKDAGSKPAGALLEQAEAVRWDSFKADSVHKEFDLVAAASRLVQRAMKAAKSGEVEESVALGFATVVAEFLEAENLSTEDEKVTTPGELLAARAKAEAEAANATKH